MAVRISSFGRYSDGREVSLYTMENRNGMRVSVANIGAALVKVEVPDRQGRLADVVLGFDRAEDYLENGWTASSVRWRPMMVSTICTVTGSVAGISAFGRQSLARTVSRFA